MERKPLDLLIVSTDIHNLPNTAESVHCLRLTANKHLDLPLTTGSQELGLLLVQKAHHTFQRSPDPVHPITGNILVMYHTIRIGRYLAMYMYLKTTCTCTCSCYAYVSACCLCTASSLRTCMLQKLFQSMQ